MCTLFSPELTLHITREDLENPITHRLVWIPYVPSDQTDSDENSNFDSSKSEFTDSDIHLLVLFYGTKVSGLAVPVITFMLH